MGINAGNQSGIRVLLVEDEPLWQVGIGQLLKLGGIELVGTAETYDEAMALYQETEPDVVLLDWKIPGSKDGIDVGETLMEKGHPSERLILISGSDKSLIPDIPYGFVPKPDIATQLTQAIQSAIESVGRVSKRTFQMAV